jgi:hypothetical protein|tara:strand:- start:1301 stop:1510 length:210 start_codon:yes stop_codon:yes gene_type:complete
MISPTTLHPDVDTADRKGTIDLNALWLHKIGNTGRTIKYHPERKAGNSTAEVPNIGVIGIMLAYLQWRR